MSSSSDPFLSFEAAFAELDDMLDMGHYQQSPAGAASFGAESAYGDRSTTQQQGFSGQAGQYYPQNQEPQQVYDHGFSPVMSLYNSVDTGGSSPSDSAAVVRSASAPFRQSSADGSRFSVHNSSSPNMPRINTVTHDVSDLLSQQWYVGSMPRDQTEQLLRSTSARCFVIRDSSRPGCFAASIFFADSGEFLHSLIEPVSTGGFAFESDRERVAVQPTVSLLVDYHTRIPTGNLCGLAPVNAVAYAAAYLDNCAASTGAGVSLPHASTSMPLAHQPSPQTRFFSQHSESPFSSSPNSPFDLRKSLGSDARLQRNASSVSTLVHLELPLLKSVKTVVLEEGETPTAFRDRMWTKYYQPKLQAEMRAGRLLPKAENYAIQLVGSGSGYLDSPGQAEPPLLSLLNVSNSLEKAKLILVQRKLKVNPLAEFSWFSEASSRQEIEDVLRTTSVNCFVIRESSKPGCYALSKYVVHANEFIHFLIQPSETAEPGFSFHGHPDLVYPNLPKLVRDCRELSDSVSIGDVHRREHIADELWRTESDYADALQAMLDIYAYPMGAQGVLKQEEILQIFANLEQIVQIHQRLRLRFQERAAIREPQRLCIGDIFLDPAEDLKIYSVFVTNFEHGMNLVRERTASDARFRKFMEQAMTDTRSHLNFSSLFIMPVQRLPRYEMMIADMLKATWIGHADYQPLQEALRHVKAVASYVNDAKAQAVSTEKLQQVEQMSRKRSNQVSIVEAGRLYLREGPLDLVRLQGKPVPKYVFLFNDIVLITNAKMDKKGTLKTIEDDFRIRILGAKVKRVSPTSMTITDDVGDEVTLQGKLPREIDSWIPELQKAIEAAQEVVSSSFSQTIKPSRA